MGDRPILFSAPMVRALLDGRKTQTRRVLKGVGERDECFQMDDGSWHQHDSRGMHMSPVDLRFAVGDRLWVRETWAHVPLKGGAMGAIYRADGDEAEDDVEDGWEFLGKWRVSIHMPRWASRLTLTVTDVRVQRLQGISEADCLAEGIYKLAKTSWLVDGKPMYGVEESCAHDTPKGAFNMLWRDINGDASWAANPWIVALTFTVQRRNIDVRAAAGAVGDGGTDAGVEG